MYNNIYDWFFPHNLFEMTPKRKLILPKSPPSFDITKVTLENKLTVLGIPQRYEVLNGRKKPEHKVTRCPIKDNEQISTVYTSSLREDTAIAFVSTQYNVTESGFIYPIQEKIRDDIDFKKKINVDMILKRRSIDGVNEYMQSSTKKVDYPFYQFVRFFDDEKDNNHSFVDAWGKKIAKTFTEVSDDEYTYKAIFKFACNVTQVNGFTNSFQYPNEYLTDDDVIEVINTIYPNYKDNEEYLDNLAESFFKNDTMAKIKIVNYDNWSVNWIMKHVSNNII